MGIVATSLPILGTTPRGDGEASERNALSALLTEFNGNVDAANCKPAFAKDNVEPAFSIFRPLTPPLVKKHVATAAGTYWYGLPQGWTGTGTDGEGDYGAPFGAGANQAPYRAGLSLVPSDLAAGGRTLKLRLKVTYIVNAVVPGSTFTWSLKPTTGFYGASGSASALVLGADVPSSPLVLAAPAANSGPTVIAQEFTAPAQGLYVIAFNIAGAMAAGSAIQPLVELQYRQV
jgi:hypothetical protein